MTFEEQFNKDFSTLDPGDLASTKFEDLKPSALKRIKENNLDQIVRIQSECNRIEESILYYAMATHRLREWESTYLMANAAIRIAEDAPVMRDSVDTNENKTILGK